MTTAQRLAQLEIAAEKHETFFGYIDRVLTQLADRLDYLLDQIPDDQFAELERRDLLDLLDAVDRGDVDALAKAAALGLTAPDTLPAS